MSYFTVFQRRTIIVWLALGAFVVVALGCGEEPQKADEAATPSKGEKRREDAVSKARQRELELKQKLEEMKIPEELPAEWFYDGDEAYTVTPEWLVQDRKLRFTVVAARKKSSSKRRGEEPKVVTAFYAADTPRGPYKYLTRTMAASLTLPQEVPLNDVQHRYYRAVIFDDTGTPKHFTTPMSPRIMETRVRTPIRRPPTTPPAEGEGEETEAVPQKTLRLAVVPLENRTEKDELSRRYIGQGLSELLRKFFSERADVYTPDPGYTDVVFGRQQSARRRPSVGTLARIGKTLDIDMLLSGTFQATPEEITVEFSVVSVATGAVLKTQPVTSARDASGEMGKQLAAELARVLKIELDAGQTAKLSMMWKNLDEQTRYVEKALKLYDEEKQSEAVAAFESVKAGEVMDGEVLLALSECYSEAGNPLRGARLCALASHVPNWEPPRDYLRTLGRLLANANDLKGSLEVLADVRVTYPQYIWREAIRLLDQSLSGRVVRQSFTGPKKDWPTLTPAWQATSEQVLVNPHFGDGVLVVFGSNDKEAVQKLMEAYGSRRRATSRTDYARAELYDTYVYDLKTGALRWQKAGLMSGAATSAIAGGALYGMGDAGPVAVSLKNGKVLWKDASGRVKGPDVVHGSEVDYGRPWWRTFELHAVGSQLVVWHPKEDVVHCYQAQTGDYLGQAYHNKTWSMVGQFFLEREDGLYFLDRGSAKLEKLTEELVANPVDLTSKMRLLSDPGAVVQNNMLFELTRRVAASDARSFDFFVVGSNVEDGQFQWVYPLLSPYPPVIADGKLFLFKKSITGRRSARVSMIDVNNETTKTIDLSALELSLYEPTISLAGGKNVLIGSQAAISAADGSVQWVNRSLPVTRDPQIVGNHLLIAPFLVDPATGKVLLEIDVPAGFNWERASVAAKDDLLLVLHNATTRARRQTRTEGRVLAYDLTIKDKAAATEGPAAAETPAAPKPLSLDEIEKVFLESRLSPPLDEQIYDLFESIAAAKYEASGSAETAVEYLDGVLKRRPHNGQHVVHLAGVLKPYASMAGQHDKFVALLGEMKEHYKDDEKLVEALQGEVDAANKDKAEAERARQYFEQVKQAEHDPLEDWPSEIPSSGSGNRGSGAAPPFNIAWTKGFPKTSPFDRVVPTAQAVFVFQKKLRKLTALDPEKGTNLWDLSNVNNFVYYRGVGYVLTEDLRAVTPPHGLVLWKKQLDPDASPADAPLAAGQDMIFLAGADGIQALDWATGREAYRLDLPEKDRLDVHGSTLVALTTRTGKLHAVEAKTGKRRWTNEVGTYSLFNGRLYAFSLTQETKNPELMLVCYHVPSGRELYRRHYELPLGRRAPALVPPAVSLDSIFVVCDQNLLHLKPETGEVMAKQTLPASMSRPLTATPTLVYVNGGDKKLTAYDITNDLTQVWELPTTGSGVLGMGPGILYFLDKNQLNAYRGETQRYSEAHLEAMVNPSEELKGDQAVTTRDAKITDARFVSIGTIRGVKELPEKMDDRRLSTIAFCQLLNVGHMRDWELMIEESTKKIAPGDRKTRQLTPDEIRMLYAEMIQRQEPGSMNTIRNALGSGNRNTIKMVLELMTTSSRSTYGPLLLRVFRDALKERRFVTAMYCAEAVGAWQYDPALDLLRKALAEEDYPEALRQTCARALTVFDSDQATSALLKVAKEWTRASSSLSRLCTDLLINRGEKGIEALGGLLASSSVNEQVRLNAARALAQSQGAEAVPYLLPALEGGRGYPPKLQAQAAASLAPLAKTNETIFNKLVENMNNPKNDPLFRNACMNGLGLSGNPQAIPHLIAIMGNQDVDNRRFTRNSAHQFLLRLSGARRMHQEPDEWRKWWEDNKDRFKD